MANQDDGVNIPVKVSIEGADTAAAGVEKVTEKVSAGTEAAKTNAAATNEQTEAERKYAEALQTTAAARAANTAEFEKRAGMTVQEQAANIGANFNGNSGVEKTEEELAKEQALLELENQRAAILHQISEARRYEDAALQAELAGETEEAAMLEREAGVRRDAVTLMRQLNIQEEQALSMARARMVATEKITALETQQLAIEREQIALQAELNAQLIAEEALRQKTSASVAANVARVRETTAAEEAGAIARSERGLLNAGKRELGGALGIGLGGLAAEVPQIAAFVALMEVVNKIGEEWQHVKKYQEEAAATQERFLAGVKELSTAQADLAEIRQTIRESKDAMASLAEETDKANRAFDALGQKGREQHSLARTKIGAMEGEELAQVDANPNLNPDERDAQKGRIREGAIDQRQQIDMESIEGEKNLAQARSEEATRIRREAEQRQQNLEQEINDKREQRTREALQAKLANEAGHNLDGQEHYGNALELNQQVKDLTQKYQEQTQAVERARDAEKKIAEATENQLESLNMQAKATGEVYDLRKKQLAAEEQAKQAKREKADDAEMEKLVSEGEQEYLAAEKAREKHAEISKELHAQQAILQALIDGHKDVAKSLQDQLDAEKQIARLKAQGLSDNEAKAEAAKTKELKDQLAAREKMARLQKIDDADAVDHAKAQHNPRAVAKAERKQAEDEKRERLEGAGLSGKDLEKKLGSEMEDYDRLHRRKGVIDGHAPQAHPKRGLDDIASPTAPLDPNDAMRAGEFGPSPAMQALLRRPTGPLSTATPKSQDMQDLEKRNPIAPPPQPHSADDGKSKGGSDKGGADKGGADVKAGGADVKAGGSDVKKGGGDVKDGGANVKEGANIFRDAVNDLKKFINSLPKGGSGGGHTPSDSNDATNSADSPS